MRLISFNRKTNEVRLKPENPDDLFHLELLVREGDLVRGKTMRRKEIKRGDKFVRAEKKPVTLTVNVEKVSFAESTDRLRLTGEIVKGTDLGKHHTIELQPGDVATIKKDWRKYELEKLKSLEKKPPKLLICVLDDEGADFALLTDRLKYLTHMKGATGKSLGEANKEQYYKQVVDYISGYDCTKVVAGPGFVKDEIVKRLEGKVFKDSTSHTGKTGVQEVIKRGIVDRVVEDSRLSEETKLVEKFLGELSKDGKAVYGKDETRKALEMGAVETLLVSDKLLRKLEPLMEKAEGVKTDVKIISSDHEAGERLYNLGGVAGILRYKVS